jgi:hypothetical protein
MGYEDWVAAGRRFGEMGRTSAWWIGDWLKYGADMFGDRYAEASRITGYDIQTLRNYCHVAGRFPAYLRRYELEYSHHAVLAALELEERTHWLDRAVEERMSVADLRGELRAATRGRADAPTDDGQHTGGEADAVMIACPHCGGPVPVPPLVPSREATA